MNTHDITRRGLLLGGAGLATTFALASCASTPTLLTPSSGAVLAAEKGRRSTGRITKFAVSAQQTDIDLAGRTASTWAYSGSVPGPVFRATVGDTIEAKVINNLPSDTSIHWHGLTLRNDMDGVPPVTQKSIAAGSSFDYRFVADKPGTYWFHPHVGPQLDRGLYAPLIIDDPDEKLSYDAEWVIVLDDWLDGVTATPDQVLAELKRGMGSMGGMTEGDSGAPMRMGNTLMGATSEILGGDAGDVYYPYYLINGKPKTDPTSFTAKPGQRVRLRIINAASDTGFRFAVGGHELTITHTDGYPIIPASADSIIIGMGERYDAIITVADGAFPIVAEAEGKGDLAFAILRSNSGSTAPTADVTSIANTTTLGATGLKAAEEVLLAARRVDRTIDIALTGGMMKYDWGIDGRAFDPRNPLAGALTAREGERVQLTIKNDTAMWHPFHLHGHTYQHAGGGPRKDTSIILPGETLTVLFDADNPGLWAAHCHNIYHAEAGMMTVLGYQR